MLIARNFWNGGYLWEGKYSQTVYIYINKRNSGVFIDINDEGTHIRGNNFESR